MASYNTDIKMPPGSHVSQGAEIAVETNGTLKRAGSLPQALSLYFQYLEQSQAPRPRGGKGKTKVPDIN